MFKLTIGRKLAIAFTVIMLLMGLVAASAVLHLSRARRNTQALIEIQEVVVAIDSVVEKLFEERIALESYIFTGEDEGKAAFEQAKEEYEASWNIVKNHHGDEFPELINEIELQRVAVHSIFFNVLLNRENFRGDFTNVMDQMSEADTYYGESLKPVIQQLRQQELAMAQEISDEARTLSVTMLIAASAVSALAIVISIWAAIAISRGISRAATHLSEAANSISRGDLDVHIEVSTGDEMQTLAESIERMRISLKAAIERLRSR